MIDLQKYLSEIDQKHYDKWLEGRYSVAELVKNHKMMALVFRRKILNAIDDHSPQELISIFEEERPDIEIRDQEMAVERIEKECNNIKDML